MTANVFKQYLKSSYKQLILSVIFNALVVFWLGQGFLWILAFFILGIPLDVYKFQEILKKEKN